MRQNFDRVVMLYSNDIMKYNIIYCVANFFNTWDVINVTFSMILKNQSVKTRVSSNNKKQINTTCAPVQLQKLLIF